MAAPEATHHAPEQIVPQRTGDYLEVMSKAIFQTGISWQVVHNKWPGIHEAFHGFDHRLVASFTEAELAGLCADTRHPQPPQDRSDRR
jgi:3-methyladenine DNA glycosylase Tag